MSINTAKPTWQTVLWKKNTTLAQQGIMIILGVIVLAIASQISIPFQPIPLTFQSATAILIGLTYGSRQGAAVMVAYYLAGLLGAPVFSNFGFGLHPFFGPTGGYLIGFLPATFIAGWLAERGWTKNIFTSLFTSLIAATVIFSSGVFCLSAYMGMKAAITFGLLPFIYSEPVKLLAAAIIATRCWQKSAT